MPIIPWGAAPGGAGGQSPYSYIVAPSGGDYTTLSAALAAAAAGSTIYVKPGTYTEAGGAFSQNNLTIVGAGMENVSMTLSSNLVFSGNYLKMSGLTINAGASFDVALTGQHDEMFGCHIKGSSTTLNFLNVTNEYGSYHDNFIEATGASATIYFGTHNRVYGNQFIATHGHGIYLDQFSVLSNNYIQFYALNNGGGGLINQQDYSVVSNNTILGGEGALVSMALQAVFSNNFADQVGGTAITVADGCTVTGNIIRMSVSGTALLVNVATNTIPPVISGNVLYDNTASKLITGIHVQNTNQAVINGNFVYAPSVGIQIDNTCTKTVLTSNSITNYTVGITDNGVTTINANNAT